MNRPSLFFVVAFVAAAAAAIPVIADAGDEDSCSARPVATASAHGAKAVIVASRTN